MQITAPEAIKRIRSTIPRYLHTVERARRERAKVYVSLASFPEDPILLYACLWYASYSGVALVFAPEASAQAAKAPSE